MGNRIRETRQDPSRSLSQEALAYKAKVSLATIRRCERGEVPTVRTAQAIARALGTTVDYLFPGEEVAV